jgi:tRNA pseudouridine38-40 synthase
MARFKLTVEYAGTRYSGWQIQKNARTVQGEIDRAVRTATRAGEFELYGAGRTDAGVHALAQVAHLDLAITLPPETLRQRLNDELPGDINVLSVSAVPRRFHARHDAVARSYLYQIARRRTAFAKPFVWWVKEPLDVAGMRAVAALFSGLQDFQAFTADEPDDKSTRVLVESVEFGEDGDLLLIRVRGSHFLWKMVRRLVGVMVEAGRDRLTVDDVRPLLLGPSDVPGRLTAPASGLFLERVFYKGDPQALPLRAAVSVRFPQ